MINASVCGLVSGDRICEADGFVWIVEAIVRETAAYRTLRLVPEFKTMLNEQPCEKRFKKTSIVRKA